MTARWAVSDQSREPAMRWDLDKRHRCPSCWAVAIDDRVPSKREVYQCCRCGRRFCAFPWLARVLPFAGVACSEHRERPPGSVTGRFVYRVSPPPSVSAVVRAVSDEGVAELALSDGGTTWAALRDIEGAVW